MTNVKAQNSKEELSKPLHLCFEFCHLSLSSHMTHHYSVLLNRLFRESLLACDKTGKRFTYHCVRHVTPHERLHIQIPPRKKTEIEFTLSCQAETITVTTEVVRATTDESYRALPGNCGKKTRRPVSIRFLWNQRAESFFNSLLQNSVRKKMKRCPCTGR